jgi:hypothetical protein
LSALAEKWPAAAEREPPLLAGLIRNEVLEMAGQFAQAFDTVARLGHGGVPGLSAGARAAFDEVAAQARKLQETLEMLALLAETHAGDDDESRERFFLSSLIKDILQAKPGLRQTRFVVKEAGREIAPVYGNRRWFSLALTHLLHELDMAIHPVEQRIAINLCQLGNHLVAHARNESMPHGGERRAWVPLPGADGLSFGCCKRIVQLHNGSLRLDLEESGGKNRLMGFTLSVPTSTTMHRQTVACADCAVLQQVESYATDLAELMEQCRELEENR